MASRLVRVPVSMPVGRAPDSDHSSIHFFASRRRPFIPPTFHRNPPAQGGGGSGRQGVHPEFGPGATASAPAIAVSPSGEVYVVKQGVVLAVLRERQGTVVERWDDSLMGYSFNGSSPPSDAAGQPIGASGAALSPPSMVLDAANAVLHLAVRGPSNSILYYRGALGNPPSWSVAQTVAASGFSGSNSQPSVCVDSKGTVHVAAQATDNTLWYFSPPSSGTEWSGTQVEVNNAKVTAQSAPSVGIDAEGDVSIAALGASNTLVCYTGVPNARTASLEWSSETVGNSEQAFSVPSMAVQPTGEIYVAVTGPVNVTAADASYTFVYSDNAQGSPGWVLTVANNRTISAPSLSVDPTGSPHIATVESNGSLGIDEGGNTPTAGQTFISGSLCIADDGGFYLVGQADDDTMWYSAFLTNSQQYSAWVKIGGPPGPPPV